MRQKDAAKYGLTQMVNEQSQIVYTSWRMLLKYHGGHKNTLNHLLHTGNLLHGNISINSSSNTELLGFQAKQRFSELNIERFLLHGIFDQTLFSE